MNTHYKQQSLRADLTNWILVTILLLAGFAVQAQTNRQVSGTLKSKSGQVVAGVTLKLVSAQDSLHTSSDDAGFYNFRNLKGTAFKLTVTSLAYDTLVYDFNFEAGRNQMLLPPLELVESSTMLDAVNIVAKIDIVVKQDTLEYNTKDLKLREGALAEDALKKLDGVEVDKDGNVTAQGEAVTRVRINGKDFFGGDIKAATQNLPADIIEKMQIIDDYGDMANVTGNRTGDPERILNIVIDPSRNKGAFGNFRIGGGTEERYQTTASLGLMREGIQFTALGNLNNVNASLFDFNTRGGSARRGPGGGGGGMGGGMMGGGGNFGGNSNGLTNTNSIGLNYRQDVSPKLTMYGDYSYSHNTNKTLSDNINDYFNERLIEIRNSESGSIANSHRFNWNFEYKPNDKDYIKLSPTLNVRSTDGDGLQKSNNTLAGNLINRMETNNVSNSFIPNYGISGLYNHRLSQKGRNIFVDFSLNTASTEQDEERIQETFLYDPAMDTDTYIRTLSDVRNKSLNGGASLAYTEPLGQFSSLEFNYDYNFRNYDNRRFDNALDVSGQPVDDEDIFIGNRIFDYSFVTHRVGANYRYRSEKIIYSFGASVQPSILSGEATIQDQVVDVHRNGLNFAPIARFEYKFSRTKSFNVRYTGRSSEPSFSQLQPFTDYSNRTNLVTGNPDLNAEFGHELRFGFNNFDMHSGRSLFVSLSGTLNEDKIVSNRSIVVDPELGIVQNTTYLNTDGVYTMRAFYNYSFPIMNKALVFSVNGFATNGNNVSFTKDVKNVGQNYMLSQGLNIRYNPKATIEVTPGVRYSYNSTANTGSGGMTNVNNNVTSWAMTLNTSVNITPTLIFGADLAKTTNNGYNNAIGSNPFIINGYLEQRFLKGQTGAIRLHAFDILNEQTNVSRSVSENLINDSRTNRLGQYFMLTLSYRFQKFAGSSSMSDFGGGQGGQGGMGGQHRGGMGGRW